MQSFAGAETTRRFSSTLNSTWPMTRRPPKYAARKAHRVHDELGLINYLCQRHRGGRRFYLWFLRQCQVTRPSPQTWRSSGMPHGSSIKASLARIPWSD